LAVFGRPVGDVRDDLDVFGIADVGDGAAVVLALHRRRVARHEGVFAVGADPNLGRTVPAIEVAVTEDGEILDFAVARLRFLGAAQDRVGRQFLRDGQAGAQPAGDRYGNDRSFLDSHRRRLPSFPVNPDWTQG
jgi:hypothetical protein